MAAAVTLPGKKSTMSLCTFTLKEHRARVTSNYHLHRDLVSTAAEPAGLLAQVASCANHGLGTNVKVVLKLVCLGRTSLV